LAWIWQPVLSLPKESMPSKQDKQAARPLGALDESA
jgi:hypothetical protein